MASQKTDELFGLPERMKIIRLFVFNPEKAFDLEMVSQKTGVKKSSAKREIGALKKFGLVAGKKFSKIISEKPRHAKKVSGYALNQSFNYLNPLREFLLATSPDTDEVLKRFSGAGRLKLIIVAGVFTQEPESRLDILVVGDGLNKNKVRKAVESLESDIGKELSYFAVSTADFTYRMSMNDKLLRDVLDFPHEKILNKLGI